MIFIILAIVGGMLAVMLVKHFIKNAIKRFIFGLVTSLVTGAIGWNFFEKNKVPKVKIAFEKNSEENK